jgi:hypothetical protein
MIRKNQENENQEYETIVNSLKEKSGNLKMLLDQMGTTKNQIGVKYDLTTLKTIEERMNFLQNDVNYIVKSSQPTALKTQNSMFASIPSKEPKENGIDFLRDIEARNSTMILRFKNWEDFQAFASQPQAVCFTYRESDRVFEADALKSNQIAVYIGEMPNPLALLKLWLSSRLELPEKRVFEGTLTKA